MIAQNIQRFRGFLFDWQSPRFVTDSPQTLLARAKVFILAVGEGQTMRLRNGRPNQRAQEEPERARQTEAEAQSTGVIEITVKKPDSIAAWTMALVGSERGHTTPPDYREPDSLTRLRLSSCGLVRKHRSR